ncbi:MAG: DUF2946 family protein [Pseudomonadota bacterium]
MRRLLVILMLLIVPLQLSYAAASVYCQHETGKGAGHFGHHSHVHKDDAGHEKGGAKLKALHEDCGTCHLGAPHFLLQDFQVAPIKVASSEPWAQPMRYGSTDPARIERPNWTVSP